jgi:hypothetical protein
MEVFLIRLRTLFLIAAAMFLAGGLCNRVPEREWERGNFRPIGGKPFSLESGLALISICGADEEIPASELPLDMAVRNATDRRVSTMFPAGLVFTPTNRSYQYMMLLQDFRFSVPERAETTISLPTYCCNDTLDTPDDESFYRFDIQVYEREPNELFDLVADKRLEGDTAVPLAQEALFEITEGDGLTDTMRALLRSLP